jgi:NTE family protein
MLIPPYRITLSGGGLKGVAHVGALEVLSEHGLLNSLKEYVGISAGALVAFCLCIGTSLSALRMIVSLLDFGLVRDLDPETMMNFPETFGLDTGANLEKLLKTILKASKLPLTLTFQELAEAKKGPSLRIITMNLNTCMPQEFSAGCTPSAEVVMAVKASMSIPIYFSPVRDPTTQHFLSDGGIYFASPFKFLSDEERRHTLSIAFDDKHKPSKMINGLSGFLMQLYYSLDYHTGQELRKQWRENILYIDCGLTNLLQFEASQEDRIALMEAGRQSAEDFLKHPGPKPSRRFSTG